MKRFWILSAFLVVTAVILALTTRLDSAGVARTQYWGMPVVCWAKKDTACWIAMSGQGVIVLGAGVGVVEYGAFGAGILFACGQAAAGLLAFGQAAVGLIFVCAQLGFGLTGLGQLFVGGWGIGQGRLSADGLAFLKHLNADLDDLLSFRSRPPPLGD